MLTENLQNVPNVTQFNLQLNVECHIQLELLQDLADVKEMTWVHDEHVVTIC